jgi:aspartate kinase
MGVHTVEKIGGTSMSQFDVVTNNVIIGNRTADELYQRIFVVSAYGGITDLLLEGKKTGHPGIYGHFAANDSAWHEALEGVRSAMCAFNASFAEQGLDVAEADAYVNERLNGVRDCLVSLQRLCSYGHFDLKQYLPMVREMISAVGEAHSARNAVAMLQARGVNAVFVDLTGWRETTSQPFDDYIRAAFADIDLANSLPIVTGYTLCSEGIMGTYDRGYSEITFSKVAVITQAREGIVHKEFHLSSGDPKLVGEAAVRIIGKTNYDVADQMADLGMEAIHPKASKPMEMSGISIRVKNAFEPDHPGTVISRDYRSEKTRVEIITGRRDILAIEMWDPDMVGQAGYDYRLLSHFADHNLSYIAKNTNANTITHYVPAQAAGIEACLQAMKAAYPNAEVRTEKVCIVSAIGSNMNAPGLLARAANILAEAGVNILAVDQCMRQVNMQFILHETDYERSIIALHRGLIESD